MLVAILSFLALLGGVATTNFIMDGPRRQAVFVRLRLNAEAERLYQYRRECEERYRRLTNQAHDLRDAEDALARRESEFEQRTVRFDELASENRLIKADLRNMAVVVAHSEHQVHSTEQ